MSQMTAPHPPPTSGLVHVPTRVLSGVEAQEYAEKMAKSTIMSPFFQGSPANVMYAMELGRTYGMEPSAIIANIHVFDDGQGRVKAALSADFMICLARMAGHYVHVKATKSKATATLIRRELLEMDPAKLQQFADLGIPLKDYLIFEESWDEERAMTAGLDQKPNWKKYLPDMLKARVKAAIVRAAASEVLIQMSNASSQAGNLTVGQNRILIDATHTADELGANMTDEGETVTITRDNIPPQRTTSWPAGQNVQPPPQRSAEQHPPQKRADAVSPSVVPAPVLAFAEQATAVELVEWARDTAASTELTDSDKKLRIRMAYLALKQLKRVDETPPPGTDEPTLGKAVLSHMQPFLNV